VQRRRLRPKGGTLRLDQTGIDGARGSSPDPGSPCSQEAHLDGFDIPAQGRASTARRQLTEHHSPFTQIDDRS
jgi:hypothetical protein